jgi:hypothetical protein
LFLVTMHNKGSPSVRKIFHVLSNECDKSVKMDSDVMFDIKWPIISILTTLIRW